MFVTVGKVFNFSGLGDLRNPS